MSSTMSRLNPNVLRSVTTGFASTYELLNRASPSLMQAMTEIEAMEFKQSGRRVYREARRKARTTPETQLISLRRTRRYVGTWAHLDQWEDLGTAKVLANSAVYGPEKAEDDWNRRVRRWPKHMRRRFLKDYYADPSCGPISYFRVVVPRAMLDVYGKDRVLQAIQDTFSRHGCSHEYDCCGCASYSATATYMGGREFKVKLGVGYNF